MTGQRRGLQYADDVPVQDSASGRVPRCRAVTEVVFNDEAPMRVQKRALRGAWGRRPPVVEMGVADVVCGAKRACRVVGGDEESVEVVVVAVQPGVAAAARRSGGPAESSTMRSL